VTYESGSLAPNEVRRLFDRIAPVYDVMNRVMTVGLDRSWRRLAVEAVVQPGDRVLDACCGTGDLAIAAEREGGHVTGLDFSPAMLERARRKSTTIEWVEGDMLALPFEDASFEAATVGFGVRNVVDLERGVAELRRVLRPGGRLAILNAASPVSARLTRLFVPIARNFDKDLPLDDVYAFNRQVFEEDRAIVELQCPEDLPIDRAAEAPILADRSSGAYRRALAEIGLGQNYVR